MATVYYPEESTTRSILGPSENGGTLDEIVAKPDSYPISEDRINQFRPSNFSYRISAAEIEQLRRTRIKSYRNWFSLFAVLLVVAATACLFTGLPYQPLVAMLIATIGIVIVLAMKATGK